MNQAIVRLRGIEGRESGAAMLIVMMVLLVVTASATMAVSSAQFEIRAAGHQRQAMQTGLVAESGLVAATTTIEMLGGARVLRYRMERARRPIGTRLSAEDPPLDEMNDETERFFSNRLVPGEPNIRARTTEAAGFGLTAFEPRYIIDINDGYNVLPTFVGQGQGTRVDGNGTVNLQYFVATVTSRGRMVRNGLLDANGGYGVGSVFTPAEASRPAHLRRDIFETSVTARAVTISGPYASM